MVAFLEWYILKTTYLPKYLFSSHFVCGCPPSSFRYQHGFVGSDKDLLVAVVNDPGRRMSFAVTNRLLAFVLKTQIVLIILLSIMLPNR